MDVSLRRAYASALLAEGDARGELIELEERIRESPLDAPGYWNWKQQRNALRDAIDVSWRARFGYGVRPGRHALLPWPDDVSGRWRSLREFVEDFTGVRLKDIGASTSWKALRAQAANDATAFVPDGHALGFGVREWLGLLDEVIEQNAWQHLFRDVLGLTRVRSEFFSLFMQAEGDTHWTVAENALGAEDPPVYGFLLDYDGGRFVPDPRRAPYGHFARVTDFARAMLDAYAREFRPHPRLELPLEKEPPRAGRAWATPLSAQPKVDLTERFAYQNGIRQAQEDLSCLCGVGDENTPMDARLAELFDGSVDDLVATVEEEFDIELRPFSGQTYGELLDAIYRSDLD
ncbi:MAG: hypothetical protein AAGE52_21955 [Myxococcota bacterium]